MLHCTNARAAFQMRDYLCGRCRRIRVFPWLAKHYEPNALKCLPVGAANRMKLVRVAPKSIPDDAKIQIFRCSKCEHELRLTVWALRQFEPSPPLAPRLVL